MREREIPFEAASRSSSLRELFVFTSDDEEATMINACTNLMMVMLMILCPMLVFEEDAKCGPLCDISNWP